MHTDSSRFYQSPLLIGQGIGQRHNLIFSGDKQILCAAGGLETFDPQYVTDVVIAPPARATLAADELGAGCSFIANLDPGNSLANGFDLGGELVALDDRVGSERVFAVIDVNVGAADAYLLDAQKYPARADLRLRNVTKFDFTRFCHYCLSHIFVSLNSES